MVATMDTVGKRIKHLRTILGMHQEDLAKLLKVSRGAVGNWERGEPIFQKNLKALANATGASLHWLEDGIGKAPQTRDDLETASPRISPSHNGHPKQNEAPALREIMTAPLRGKVAAGVWLEFDSAENERREMIPYVPERYPDLEQFAYQVEGVSMDLERIFDGDYVICVDYSIVRAIPQAGDIVVAERWHRGLLERACKKLEMHGGQLALVSKSSDPRFKGEIPLGSDPEFGSVEVKGLVIGTYSARF